MIEKRMLWLWKRSAFLFFMIYAWLTFAYVLFAPNDIDKEIADRYARTVVTEINMSGEGATSPSEVRKAVAKAILKHNEETVDEGDVHLLAPEWRAVIGEIAQTGKVAKLPPASPGTAEKSFYLRAFQVAVPLYWLSWAFLTAAWLRFKEPQWPMPLTKHPWLWMLITLPGLVWYIPGGRNRTIIERDELRRRILDRFSTDDTYGGDTIVACDSISRAAQLADSGEQLLEELCRFPGVVGISRDFRTVKALLFFAANNSHWRVVEMRVFWKKDGSIAFRFRVLYGEPLIGDFHGIDVIETPGHSAKAAVDVPKERLMPSVGGYIPFGYRMTTGAWEEMIEALEKGELPKERTLLPEDQ